MIVMASAKTNRSDPISEEAPRVVIERAKGPRELKTFVASLIYMQIPLNIRRNRDDHGCKLALCRVISTSKDVTAWYSPFHRQDQLGQTNFCHSCEANCTRYSEEQS